MDQNTKKKIIIVRELIKKEKYQQALEQAEIIVYKNSKLYQAHLMAGLCYDKLGKIKQAEKSYKQVLQLKPEQANAIKALTDIYIKMGKTQQSTKCMEQLVALQKQTDPPKYKQNLIKLVQLYQKDLNMEKIDIVFKQLLASQKEISEQFVTIAESYFKTGITNQCFYLDQFLPLGVKEQTYRPLQPNAKQKLNDLLVQIVRYLYSVKIQYKMSNKDIAASIYQMKQCFPYASCFLMLFLLDDYIVSQVVYNSVILQQIYLLLTAFYDKADNCYLNFETLQPEFFVVSIVLSYEFLAFMKEFFTLDLCFNPYYQRLQAQVPEFQSRKVREQYANKMERFILKECRTVSKISETQNIENRLESLKYRIIKLDGSYLQEVVAKMAMNCFVDYQKLCDMRNLLKTRINNLQAGQIQPHLYKYYYDYLMKIAKLYKSLDEELSIYDVIEYIKTNDDKDLKYLLQYCWIQVGKNSKKETPQIVQSVKQNLKQISQLLPQLTGSLKSQGFRKQSILKIYLENYDGILDGFKLALGTDRSFQNLQCIGFYYFVEENFEKALRYLKQAFVIKQDDYHLNRAIFVAMVKTKELKQAYSFLQRIYQGFPNVYWINYALAMNSINNKKIQLAYKYLSAALQSFISGVQKSFRFSYQRTIEGNKYSLLYMIDQNKHHILYDTIVVPQKIIYNLFPYASSIFFDSDQLLKQIRIETQLGQVLKLLGRNKSSYNHLASAYSMVQSLSQQVKQQNIMQVITTKKQFATMLFYVRAYKEAGDILKNALRLCLSATAKSKIPENLLSSFESQIHSLMFEVSVMRLDDLMKFQSYESVRQYIIKFTEDLKQLNQVVKKPSLNYYKSKYQFYILCYLHNKQFGITKSIETIKQFLNYFGLDSAQIQADKFYNRVVQLGNEERIIVKQCLQDYYVLLFMKQNGPQAKNNQSLSSDQILPLIQLFPMSTVFYIVYGMTVKQNKLKIAAFLKCIQLDRESPISVDLLASLFLKENDYVTACKLFLKSLEIDLFNPKSYIGLCTCLYALIGSSIRRGAVHDKQIIRKALNKINSYMEFLRITDPSENYHMLKFLKTLISDQPIPLFDLKTGLEQSRKLAAHKYSQKLLFQLLEDSTQYLKQLNVWTKDGQDKVLSQYLSNNKIDSTQDLYSMGVQLLKKVQEQIAECKFEEIKSGQIRIKHKCKILNKLCVIANILCKTQCLKQTQRKSFINICSQLEQPQQIKDQQLAKLQKNAKELFIVAFIKSQKKQNADGQKILERVNSLNFYQIFKSVLTFSHVEVLINELTQEKLLIPLKKYIIRCVHLNPCDPFLRKCLVSLLLIIEKKNNKSMKKVKQIVDYRFDNMLQVNADEQANNSQKFHKKLAMLYNINEPNAWVGFICSQWRKNRQTKWVQHLSKIVKKYENSENILTKNSKQRAEWTITEMAAQKIMKKQKINIENYPKYLKNRIQGLVLINEILCSGKDIDLSKSLSKIDEETQIYLFKYIAPYLVNKYQNNKQLQQMIENCIKISNNYADKGYYTLLKFISICSKSSSSEDELIDQLSKLLNIIHTCEINHSKKTQKMVHQNSFSVMKCMAALLSLNYEQLEQQLSNAYGNRLVTYSDQVLINYFEVMKSYKEVETNHQGQNVFQNFTYYVDCMISISKQPYIKGFFYSLKAMAGAIVAQQNASKLSRQLKYATLLSPSSSKSMLTRN